MPQKCFLFLLDGLGDRSYAALGHKTPLQSAYTPFLDGLAEKGGLGLYHAGMVGQALPSENAHFAMFGRKFQEFPGRGALEALGADVPLADNEVAVLVHLGSVAQQDGVLTLVKDTPRASDEDIDQLVGAVRTFEHDGVSIRYHRTNGHFGVLILSGNVSPFFTDTGVMVEGAMIPEVRPWASHAHDGASIRSASALTAYLRHAYGVLSVHSVNEKRIREGLAPFNMPLTQRAGMLKCVPSMREAYGLRCLSVSSGCMYRGLSKFLGIDHLSAPHTGNVYADYTATISMAMEQGGAYDFLHVHTKAPDVAAHTKSPEAKRDAIAELDRALADMAAPLTEDPRNLLIVTGDHSTPSSGPLIHSGEPVPLLFYGDGVRRDVIASFDEISAASGALGTVRGRELMLLVLNHLDRAKLAGIMDTPVDQPYYPGNREPFRME